MNHRNIHATITIHFENVNWVVPVGFTKRRQTQTNTRVQTQTHTNTHKHMCAHMHLDRYVYMIHLWWNYDKYYLWVCMLWQQTQATTNKHTCTNINTHLSFFIWGDLKTCTWCTSLLKSKCRYKTETAIYVYGWLWNPLWQTLVH